MTPLRVYVEGVGVWSPSLGGYADLQASARGATPVSPPARPPATALPANERRRAPESVLLAIEVAGQAVAMSGRDPATLACVFASSHGDQPITDYMCATLARAPAELSPIRFHNSVHNAAVGYWTIATGCHAASTAVCAQRASFGAGLLEAVSQVLTANAPVLLACSDTAGSGPLREVTDCDEPFGCAMVLAPAPGAATLARLDITLAPAGAREPLPAALARQIAVNPSAESLPLLLALATGSTRCRLAAAAGLDLLIDMENVA